GNARDLAPVLMVTLELYRGDQLRDTQRVQLSEANERTCVYRLSWGDTPGSSSRLTALVRIGGVEVARSEVLLGRPGVDAQGRLADPSEQPASERPLRAYQDALHRLIWLDGPPEKGEKREPVRRNVG